MMSSRDQIHNQPANNDYIQNNIFGKKTPSVSHTNLFGVYENRNDLRTQMYRNPNNMSMVEPYKNNINNVSATI